MSSKLRRNGNVATIIIILMVIAIGSGYAIYYFQGGKSREDKTGPVLHPVTRGPFDHIVLEQGEIESSSNVEIKCEVKSRGSGGTPILWVIPEGSYVKKGDKLVELDSSQLEQEIKTQRILVNSAEATVISSEAALKQAKIARQEYLEGTFKTEERAILSEIAVAQQDLRTAELSLASAERLAAKGTLKSLQVEAEQFSVQNARNQLDAAEGRLSVLRELTKEKMLVQFDSDIETAKARLDADRSSEIEEKDKLTELVSQIAACLIVSPTDGQVVHANKFSSRGGNEFVVEAGATVREQQTIINLPDPTMMQVKAKINESRITLVKEGMATKIKVSAVPNELLGQVTKVNKYAEPGSWFSSAVKEYATEVQIKNPPENIRTGMTAEVRIFVEQLDNALQIPVLGVYEVKGHHFTLVSTATGYETKEIMIGATNDKFVTIDDGLSEGDNIVLNPRQHLDLMDIPEIETNTNREEMKEIAADGASDAAEKESDRTDAESDRTRPGSGGPPNGGAPGGKPGAGMSADAIAGMMMQRMDTNSDGKITQEEASSNERMNSSFSDYDSNGDGSIDKSEVGAQLKKAMEQRGGGR